MLQTDYQIKCSLGVLKIQLDNDTYTCDLYSKSGTLLSEPRKLDTPVQRQLPFPHIQKARSFIRQKKTFIPRILRAVEQIPVRQSLILEFCVEGGVPVIELFESNPALVLLLALKADATVTWEAHREVIALASCRQTEISAHCSYPSEKWIVKLLGKIPPSQCSQHLLQDLKELVQRNNKKHNRVLQHIEHLNSLVVNVMLNPAVDCLVDFSFYHSACNYPELNGEVETWSLIREIVRFSKDKHSFTARKVKNIRDLQRVHDIYMEQYIACGFETPSRPEYWKPPIPGITKEYEGFVYGIFPLESSLELYQEGEKMHHCIYSYEYDIGKLGNRYAYHVISPDGEKASIMIARNDITWQLTEIRGYCNQLVEFETKDFVKKWLSNYNKRAVELAKR